MEIVHSRFEVSIAYCFVPFCSDRRMSQEQLSASGLPVALFSNSTQAILYNFKDVPVQSMLDFDYVSRRKTASIAGTDAGYFGKSR